MEEMFSEVSSFNQNIGNWDVSNCTNMLGMFAGALAFNNGGSPSISGWTTSGVTTMQSMFQSASAFNQPIGNWNVNKVTIMVEMFMNTPFNQNISKWCVTNITTEPKDFSLNSPLTFENKPKWGTCPD